MNRRGAMAAGALLVVFCGLALAAQLLDYQDQRIDENHFRRIHGALSIQDAFLRGKVLGQTPGIVERGGGLPRQLDLILPETTRTFFAGMTGSNNAAKLGQYYTYSYYLFPRQVAVTLDEPRITINGIEGYTTESNEQMRNHGYEVRLDLTADGLTHFSPSPGVHLKELANPSWFGSWRDTLTALLLPLLTALAGVRVARLLFGQAFVAPMPLAEQLACGLGLGMMVVAALTLGMKLCGFHGHGWVLALVTIGCVFEGWREGKSLWRGLAGGIRKAVGDPVTVILLATGAAVFLILFRLAAVAGIQEFDAMADWLLKAKIFFLGTGHEIVNWCQNHRLGYANMDYPTLVPALHTATYDSLGHVDEFVTKFWPTWMLLWLLLALAAMSRGPSRWFPAPLFLPLALLLLPATQRYVQWEGATLPMVFFTTLGLVQCARGLEEQNGTRLGLGLTLLFGAAMTKFEGAVFLALAAGWLALLPQARRLLKPTRRLGWVAAFCLLAALPYVYLRAHLRVVHFDSGWAGYALAHPGETFSNAPKLFLMILARQFFDPDFAKWNAPDGILHWAGRWDGWPSLYNHLTLGLPWLCLLLTGLLWAGAPARRPAMLWMLAVLGSALMVFSVIFASFISLRGLDQVITEWTPDDAAGRYLLPLLTAWAGGLVILIFNNFGPATEPAVPAMTAQPPDEPAAQKLSQRASPKGMKKRS